MKIHIYTQMEELSNICPCHLILNELNLVFWKNVWVTYTTHQKPNSKRLIWIKIGLTKSCQAQCEINIFYNKRQMVLIILKNKLVK